MLRCHCIILLRIALRFSIFSNCLDVIPFLSPGVWAKYSLLTQNKFTVMCPIYPFLQSSITNVDMRIKVSDTVDFSFTATVWTSRRLRLPSWRNPNPAEAPTWHRCLTVACRSSLNHHLRRALPFTSVLYGSAECARGNITHVPSASSLLARSCLGRPVGSLRGARLERGTDLDDHDLSTT